jgi:hypothetical protein
MNKFVIILLDLSHSTHDSLFNIYIYLSSDQCWMYESRLCNEYVKALDAFIDFVKKYMFDNVRGNICCPCKHCKNEKKYHIDDVLRSHLIKHGFMEDYIKIGINMGSKELMKQRCEIHNLERKVPTGVEVEHDDVNEIDILGLIDDDIVF